MTPILTGFYLPMVKSQKQKTPSTTFELGKSSARQVLCHTLYFLNSFGDRTILGICTELRAAVPFFYIADHVN